MENNIAPDSEIMLGTWKGHGLVYPRVTLSTADSPRVAPTLASKHILVLGAGVSGLLVAWMLLDKGYRVTIVADDWAWTKDYEKSRMTSQIAGALWEFPPGGCGLTEINTDNEGKGWASLCHYRDWALQSFDFYRKYSKLDNPYERGGWSFGLKFSTLHQFFYGDIVSGHDETIHGVKDEVHGVDGLLDGPNGDDAASSSGKDSPAPPDVDGDNEEHPKINGILTDESAEKTSSRASLRDGKIPDAAESTNKEASKLRALEDAHVSSLQQALLEEIEHAIMTEIEMAQQELEQAKRHALIETGKERSNSVPSTSSSWNAIYGSHDILIKLVALAKLEAVEQEFDRLVADKLEHGDDVNEIAGGLLDEIVLQRLHETEAELATLHLSRKEQKVVAALRKTRLEAVTQRMRKLVQQIDPCISNQQVSKGIDAILKPMMTGSDSSKEDEVWKEGLDKILKVVEDVISRSDLEASIQPNLKVQKRNRKELIERFGEHFGDAINPGSDENGFRSSYSHQAPIVNTDKAMAYLMAMVKVKGAGLETRQLTEPIRVCGKELLQDYGAHAIVNATGLASKHLAEDDDVYPARGAVRRVENTRRGRFQHLNDAYLVPAQHDRRGLPSKTIFIVPRNDEVLYVGSIIQPKNYNKNLTQESPEVQLMWDRAGDFIPRLRYADFVPEYPFAQGLRPFTTNNVKVRADERVDFPLVHNYGHGGSGWTLGIGTARCAVYILETLLGAAGNSETGETQVREPLRCAFTY